MSNKYWDCGPIPGDQTIESFVDENIGEALKSYIEDGMIMLGWFNEPEPEICFSAGAFTSDTEFEKKINFYEMLVNEIDGHRPGDVDSSELFFDPQGDRRIVLLQELLKTYLKWKEEGVHVPNDEDKPERTDDESL